MANVVKETRLMWGMPITVAIIEPAHGRGQALIARVFAYLAYIDDTFSPAALRHT